MSKAFLSHSSKNKSLVEKIGQQLGKDNCHLDTLTFEAGEKTLEEIFKGLNDTDIFVLFISEPALESDWVKKEITAAKKLLDKKIIDRIFPLIIDKDISYKDPRIPDWIKKPYNIKYFDNEVLVLQKIKQLLRESNFKTFSHLKDIDELFVGRHRLLEEFERKIFNIDNIKPSCLIAYNFFEGMGRRTFLKNALIRTRIIDKWYDPIFIPFSSKESIEDFIYKLNFIEKTKEIFDYDFSSEELDSKINIAANLVKKFIANNELIFIIDDGGIVLPNTLIVPWFTRMLESENFINQVAICIVSKFKPKPIFLRQFKNIISFQVDELSPSEVQILFIQYLNHMGVDIQSEDSRIFIDHLHGIPNQVIYAANLISTAGVQEAKRYIDNIDEFDELSVVSVLDFLKDYPLCKQMLIALSKFEIISYDLVYHIFGENDEVYKSIQKLYDLGLFYNVSSTHQYLKLNTSVADYINRSKLNLEGQYNSNLKEIIKSSIAKPLDLDEYSDFSEFLILIQDMIRSGKAIPSKYYLPSFILKSIVQEYYLRNYKVVIELATRIIEASQKFDSQIIRETRYWLCLAYCRTQDPKFFEEVQYFKNDDLFNLKDFFFLLGFFHRIADNMPKAEEYFDKVLSIDEEHSKTKREMVNVYLRKRDYGSALSLAEDNYYKHRTNIHHINAYFTCLIKKPDLTEDDYEMLDELLDRTETSLDKRADEFYNTMSSEYEYYINRNLKKAISDLLESMRLNKNNYHSFKALSEIYRREGLEKDLEELNKTYPSLAKQEE